MRGQDGRRRHNRARVFDESQARPRAEMASRAWAVQHAETPRDRRPRRHPQNVGCLLLHEPFEEGKILGRCGATPRVFPVRTDAARDVPRVRAHLRPENRRGRRAVQMERTGDAAPRLRRHHRPPARRPVSRHVPARRQVQPLRDVPADLRQAAARRHIPAAHRRADLQLPDAREGQAVAALAR